MGSKEELVRVKRRDPNTLSDTNEGSLDQILVKHKSRLEKEKMAAAQQPDDRMTHFVSRREARERELQEAWGGIGLGNSIHPHVSRLERDKACFSISLNKFSVLSNHIISLLYYNLSCLNLGSHQGFR